MKNKMRKIKFELEEESKANKIYLQIEYMGGDADTQHFEEHQYPFLYSEYADHLKEIEEDYDKYMIIKQLTDGSSGAQDHDYDDLVEKYGKEIANLYDNVPNDPQGDYQWKTSLVCVTLIGYDEKGNKYESYL